MADTQDTGALEGAAEIEVIDTPKDDAQGGAPSAEDKARLRGWKPEEEFSGDKSKWVDAETFIQRGEDEPALLRANLKRLEAKYEAQAKSMRAFADFASKSEERAYKRAVADLESRQAEAVAAGDVGAVKAITREITDLATEAKAGTPAAEAVDDTDAVDDFIARNAWYTDNDPAKEDAQLWAQALCNKLAGEGKTPKQQLAEVEKRVKSKFPTIFENPRRTEPGAVEGRQAVPRKAVKSYDNLPAEAKLACDRFVRDKLITREDYVKGFEW